MKTPQILFDEGATLAQIRDFSSHHIDARDLRSYLIAKRKWAALIAVPSNETLFNATDGLRIAAEESRPITLNPTSTQGLIHIGMLQEFRDANKIDEAEQLEIIAMAAANKPYSGFTDTQFKTMERPPVLRDVAIAGGAGQVVLPDGSLQNTSNRGGFRFTFEAAEDFEGVVTINTQAKTEGETVFTDIPQATTYISLKMVAGQKISHLLQRNPFTQGYRHFKHQILEPFANALANDKVESIV